MIESTIHFLKHLFGFCGEPHPNIFIGGIGLIGYCFNGWWIYAYFKEILGGNEYRK